MEDPSGKKKQPKEAVAAESQGGTDDLKALSMEELNTLLNEVLEHVASEDLALPNRKKPDISGHG